MAALGRPFVSWLRLALNEGKNAGVESSLAGWWEIHKAEGL
jgi:hypothetical protein